MGPPYPPADPGVDRDVLLAVGAGVRHRRADDARSDLELIEHGPVGGVHRLEPAVQRVVENDVARGGQRAAPHGKRLLYAPDLFAMYGVPCAGVSRGYTL